jgi:hypothetical protein|tara:strand:+ start:16090 stop:17460 length:1371 start_codon:yes stop_codon:yes gene_type:complete
MATFRVGVGSFNIQDGAVGFGTDTDGLGSLKVKGVTKTTDIKVSGASTLTRYSGFAADNINQLENITLTSEVGTIGDIVVGVGTSVIISSASTVTVGTVESVSIGTHFSPPTGGIEERGQDFVEGMMRFNTDLNTMEFYNGNEWRQFTYISDIKNSPSSRGRGVIGGGRSPNHTTSMEFIQFHTLGSAQSFGDLQNNSTYKFPNSSAVRGIFSGGYEPSGGGYDTNIINYITIASAGDATDFGDLVTDSGIGSGASSSTRGLQFGGYVNPGTNHNVIQYIEMSTLGNSLDFGDTSTTLRGWGAANSTIRAVIAGGDTGSAKTSGMEFVTISSLGNGREFGDLTLARRLDNQNASGSIRGVFLGGGWGSRTDTIDFVNFASLGNAVDFGNLTNETALPATCASVLRGIVCGGYSPHVNIIEFVTIATAGNAQDFGDMTDTRHAHTAVSDCHGGLGGY